MCNLYSITKGHPGAVACPRSRRRGAKEPGLELLPVVTIVDPFPRREGQLDRLPALMGGFVLGRRKKPREGGGAGLGGCVTLG
jgi:hypothetical protein